MQPKYLIGTLFDQEEITKKLNLQTIKNKDPMGNTRWQGAFTGGFTAGYKNTCGSNEGWQPAEFISSISKRAEKKEQNVLDFMDKQDLGRESISANIKINKNFIVISSNPFNISNQQSMGEKILSSLKKQKALCEIPCNQRDLEQLLSYYQKKETAQQRNSFYHLTDLQALYTVGSNKIDAQDDQFIQSYQELYKKVIRADIKEETQQQIDKRREENKIHFDFTKPIQQQPEYLREIHQIQEMEKPRKRKRNLLQLLKLNDIFTQPIKFKAFQQQTQVQRAPQDYDPFLKIKNLKEYMFFNKTVDAQKRVQGPKHRIFSIEQRSNILGTQRLSNKFVSSSNIFMKGSKQTDQKAKYFIDTKKNQRYLDYVDELEGRKISSQNDYMSFQQAQKQKQQFESIYTKKKKDENTKQQIKKQTNIFSSDIQKALCNQKQNQKGNVTIKRTVSTWRPEKILCKRFGCLIPYKIQAKNQFTHGQQDPSYY